jgi:hypothetical protein
VGGEQMGRQKKTGKKMHGRAERWAKYGGHLSFIVAYLESSRDSFARQH